MAAVAILIIGGLALLALFIAVSVGRRPILQAISISSISGFLLWFAGVLLFYAIKGGAFSLVVHDVAKFGLPVALFCAACALVGVGVRRVLSLVWRN